MSDAPPISDEDGDIPMEVYDFKLDGVTEVDGAIQLSIPLALGVGEIPAAAYLTGAGEWEPIPHYYDSSEGKVIIMTDHLSRYGVFTVKRGGLRSAELEYTAPYARDIFEVELKRVERNLQAIKEYGSKGMISDDT